MLISTKGRYALRIMTELASHDPSEYVPLSSLAGKQNISVKYLEGIIASLSRAKAIEGLRGKGGGYRLNRPPEEYSVGEILRLSGESLSPVTCLDCQVQHCKRAADCKTLPMWSKLDCMISGYLDNISLRDLMDGNV